MLKIRVKPNDIQRKLRQLARDDAPIVTAYALTKTGQDIKAAEIASMKVVFDRPSRFTLNSLYLQPATKTDLTAIVYFKSGFGSVPAWKYLGPQVEGGARKHKSHERRLIRAGHMHQDEFAVPGAGAKLDQYGNMTGAAIERILSQLGAAEQLAGYQANATNSRRSRAKRRGGRYFVLRDKAGKSAGVPPGVYFRKGLKELVPVIMFVQAPSYRERFPFYETAQAVFNAKLLGHARDGFERFVVAPLKKTF